MHVFIDDMIYVDIVGIFAAHLDVGSDVIAGINHVRIQPGDHGVHIVEYKDKRCIVCGEPSTLKCSKCRVTRFCTQSCMKIGWRVHKTVCAELRAMNSVDPFMQ